MNILAQIRNFLFILLSLNLSVGALNQPANIKFEHLTPDDGLAQIIVGTIIQDSRGFMWFGTRGGLNRYDGYKFELYENDAENPHSISSNSIYHLYEDHMGVLWAGTANGLNKFDHRTNKFTVYKNDPADPNSLSGNIVWSIFEDSNKILWIGTHDGLRLPPASYLHLPTMRFEQTSGRQRMHTRLEGFALGEVAEGEILGDPRGTG